MVRNAWPIAAMFAVGCLSVLGYSLSTRTGEVVSSDVVDSRPARVVAAAAPPTSPPEIVEASPLPAVAQEPSSSQPSEASVAKWVADSASEDAKARATAITALATAPKAKALPALGRVLTAGNPQTDRRLALRSLRVLAQREGDDDGSIREVLRRAIYHGDDDATTRGAQSLLDDIERGPHELPASPVTEAAP